MLTAQVRVHGLARAARPWDLQRKNCDNWPFSVTSHQQACFYKEPSAAPGALPLQYAGIDPFIQDPRPRRRPCDSFAPRVPC